MATHAEVRRPWNCYNHSQESSIKKLGNDIYESVYLPFVNDLSSIVFLENDFRSLRQILGNIISDLNTSAGQRKLGTGALFCLAYAQEHATQLGVLSAEEIQVIQDGDKLVDRDGAEKYLTQDDLRSRTEEWHQEGKVIGLVHGSFDPPHIAHARLLAYISQYCDVLLVGVDPDELLRKRKGEDRPRFPLAARLRDIGILPSVDGVFVLPIKDNTDEEYKQLYRDLHISVLGSAADNAHRSAFEERMKRLGGIYIPGASESIYSSTRQTSLLENSSVAHELGFSLRRAKDNLRE